MRITPREELLARRLNWSYEVAKKHKREWFDLPPFIRQNKSFSNHMEAILGSELSH